MSGRRLLGTTSYLGSPWSGNAAHEGLVYAFAADLLDDLETHECRCLRQRVSIHYGYPCEDPRGGEDMKPSGAV